MFRCLPLLLPLAACGSDALVVSPTSLSWGEVDFQRDLPPEGYDAREIVLRNDGRRTLDVQIEQIDTRHLVLSALVVSESPPTLPTLDSEASSVIQIGVLAYEPGERETEVSGTLQLDADGLKNPILVPWSFVPVRNITVDTAP